MSDTLIRERQQSRRTRQRWLRPNAERSHQIYLVRNHPERFSPNVVEVVHDTREMAINAIGDVWDWDCDHCQMAVITYSIKDPCPHCRKG